jgi:2,3-diketo-5-methylthio-1-phosphopentane phosphatase
VKRDGDEIVSPAVTRTLVVDWDGTITEHDMLDDVAQRFGDPVVYGEIDDALHANRITLRDCITREYEPVRAHLDEVVGYVLERTTVRAGFHELVALAAARGWRLVILSSGFHQLIRPVLARERVDVELIANSVDPDPAGWRVRWRDEAICPVCGEACKRASLPDGGGQLVYVGDGFSDRCAARASDRIFARRTLARYLSEQGVPFEPFDDFFDIVAALEPPA